MGTFTIRGNFIERKCQYCDHITTSSALPRHEKHCYLNPMNIKLCPVCEQPIKNFKENRTCSYSCGNTFFRSGEDHPNWKANDINSSEIISHNMYRRICFSFHKKECVICGESLVVEAHHYDNNKKNNHPINLIPLCPTHHKYWHSRHKHLIKEQIDLYIKNFKGGENF